MPCKLVRVQTAEQSPVTPSHWCSHCQRVLIIARSGEDCQTIPGETQLLYLLFCRCLDTSVPGLRTCHAAPPSAEVQCPPPDSRAQSTVSRGRGGGRVFLHMQRWGQSKKEQVTQAPAQLPLATATAGFLLMTEQQSWASGAEQISVPVLLSKSNSRCSPAARGAAATGYTNKAPSIQALLEHALCRVLLITPCHKRRQTGSPCAQAAQPAALGLSPGVHSDIADAGVSVPVSAKGPLKYSQSRQGLSLPTTAASFTPNVNTCHGESSSKPAHPITTPTHQLPSPHREEQLSHPAGHCVHPQSWTLACIQHSPGHPTCRATRSHPSPHLWLFQSLTNTSTHKQLLSCTRCMHRAACHGRDNSTQLKAGWSKVNVTSLPAQWAEGIRLLLRPIP